MEKLTFEDYQKNGGKCSMSDFPLLLVDAERWLAKITFERIEKEPLTDEIKVLITKIIDECLNREEIDERLTSYSDGIESFGYNSDALSSESTEKKIYNLCKRYLPSRLTYRGLRK